jgi:release factor glutamine methyltransferase
LAAAGVASPAYDADALLRHAFGAVTGRLDRALVVPEQVATQFATLVARRAGREPLQHLVGSVGFRHLDLDVGPGVFVPRPESELMTGHAVDEVLARADQRSRAVRVVDLCAGSGAIGLSVALEVPDARVTAVELSEDACHYARRNAERLGADVRSRYDLRCGDIADAVDDLAGRVDVVVANPPYIPLTAFESVQPEARDFDPPLALWSGEDGLDAISLVAEVAARLLVDGGLVLCEHADAQHESAPAVFAATGAWSQVRDHPDLAGRPRFVSARRVGRSAAGTGTMAP